MNDDQAQLVLALIRCGGEATVVRLREETGLEELPDLPSCTVVWESEDGEGEEKQKFRRALYRELRNARDKLKAKRGNPLGNVEAALQLLADDADSRILIGLNEWPSPCPGCGED